MEFETKLESFDDKHVQKVRILKLFQISDFVPTAALRIIAYQYNARIYELRKSGYHIVSDKEDGKCGFRLVGWNYKKVMEQ